MPPVITELPEVVRNQIAAGEVVERPASVVKELVENALDAGARTVRVDLEEGGARLTRVSDDGCGMERGDVELAFVPHATSKLRTVDDLEHIASLGFRGEALASIGSVARCRLLSRTPDRETGFSVENEGGRIGPVTDWGGPVGTIVEMRDLFYNTPARRRFLKRTATEHARCLDVVQRAALAHVGVGFVVTHDGRRVLDVSPEMDLRDRVRRLFGAELADALVPVHGVDGTTELSGLVAPARFSRRDASRQMWFLNGRALRDKVLIRALKEGYRGFLDDHRQPVAFLQLSLDPRLVDVNVHPTKSEVRFRDDRRLFGFLVRVVRDAVAGSDLSTPGEKLLDTAARRGGWIAPAPRQGSLPDPGGLAERGAPVVREVAGRPFEPPAPREAGALSPESPAGATLDRPTDAGEPGEASGWAPRDELAGPFLQVARTYLLRALPDGFEIVDQHALHERLTFEGLRAELAEGRVESQRLLVPALVECSRSEVRLVEQHAGSLRPLGLELAAFGETTVAVQALPARLGEPDVEELVRALVDTLAETQEPPPPDVFLEELLHRRACRSSVMAGDPLGQDEIESLLRRAAELESDQTCPHGRPTRVRFTLADLEKAFHRR